MKPEIFYFFIMIFITMFISFFSFETRYALIHKYHPNISRWEYMLTHDIYRITCEEEK